VIFLQCVFAGEANRLVASLVKNSRSSEVMSSVVSCGGLKHLISLMTSEHVLMQNEAVFALTLLVSVLSGGSGVVSF
jgi:Armadillo/beta-catenin-like repeat